MEPRENYTAGLKSVQLCYVVRCGSTQIDYINRTFGWRGVVSVAQLYTFSL